MAFVVLPLRVAIVVCTVMACGVFSTWRVDRIVQRGMIGAQPRGSGRG
ncbi:MAG: hypothetical protein WCB85_13665 [Candidatus Dormiibacterota bacterium]